MYSAKNLLKRNTRFTKNVITYAIFKQRLSILLYYYCKKAITKNTAMMSNVFTEIMLYIFYKRVYNTVVLYIRNTIEVKLYYSKHKDYSLYSFIDISLNMVYTRLLN